MILDNNGILVLCIKNGKKMPAIEINNTNKENKKNQVGTFCPKNRQDWRAWLQKNHEKEGAIWLIFYKIKSPMFNISWSDSVDEALCFGWIDSVKKRIDNESFKQYFTQRKAKSNWSKVNKEKVQTLIEQGLMQAAGFKSIEIAKENGSWESLDSIEALDIPNDLKVELAKHDSATQFFNGLSKSQKKILLYWVLSAKREETRQKRIIDIAQNAAKNQKPKPFR